jgi:hypothetical protein
MIGEYEITDPRTRTCEFCDQQAAGRVMVELFGGSLWLCASCFELLRENRSRPYSRVMDKFSMRACGYHASAKMARLRR